MAGLLNIGTDYKNRALSGFIRDSARSNEITQANKQLASQEKNQTTQTIAAMGGLGAALGFAGVGEMAALGAWGGPVGLAGGLALGFLFSELF